ncbi:MAG: HlyC/CorC family transporter, partial [Anaerolineae bacterium]|nr:HlyC/CorC family transporter [Anaerolineae bacterium]
MELLFLIVLFAINGVFAMSELAVVSVRSARLQSFIDEGDQSAVAALKLANAPNRFLSTVQIGITLVGIVIGAFGGSALAGDLAQLLTQAFPTIEDIAYQVSFALIVALTTYLNLVIGELVPKRIALNNPERMAMLVARPMRWLSIAAAPVVTLLSWSTDVLTRLLGIRNEGENSVTDYEIVAMMREGLRSGSFQQQEQEMVKGALELDDLFVREILTPRTEIIWLEQDDSLETIRERILSYRFSAYPVCDGDLDHVIGVVRAKDLLAQLLRGEAFALREVMLPPLFVPETALALDVLNRFKTAPVHMAIILGEYGGIDGLVTLNDIVEEVVGDVDMNDPAVTRRADGSWLLDGNFSIHDMEDILPLFQVPEDEENDYNTLAGFV